MRKEQVRYGREMTTGSGTPCCSARNKPMSVARKERIQLQQASPGLLAAAAQVEVLITEEDKAVESTAISRPRGGYWIGLLACGR